MMTDSLNTNGSASSAPLVVSGPSGSPWLKILFRCLLFTAPVVALIAILGWIVKSAESGLSALFGGALVLVFFGISLLIAHLVGRKNPTAMFGAFIIGYIVKFFGIAGVLFSLGTPDWFERVWFLIAALASVLIWLTVEIVVFSQSRLQIFNDPVQEGDAHA